MNKRAKGLGYWDDSPRFFDESFGTLMSKTMFTGIHPDEDRYLNVREMMHLMGLPHDYEIDALKNINHIAQVRNCEFSLLAFWGPTAPHARPSGANICLRQTFYFI